MTEHDTVEPIHLADDLGNSAVLRITGQDDRGLNGVIEIGSYFVSGGIKTRLTSADLAEWEDVLDSLAKGADAASWREGQRAPEVHLETDGNHVTVAVVDSHAYLVTVELTIEVAEGWIDDHRERLAATRALLPG
ncbi:DUF5959 family protein [Actinomadura monticuli]|uniref:DUF5959 family protein n=1 Tax=Actinomadura monticuli TaxID=3097367 RepID=A0ABV4Q376_9ACTN